MNRQCSSQEVSPIYEVEPQHDRSPARGRKMSTGGNRSWSEEEEAYLLRTRAQKMPYKHIAAHLKKTELACRLHYHQLSHGSHRRKRSTSVASSISSCSTRTTPSLYESDEFGTSDSRQLSPISSTGASPSSRFSALNGPTGGSSFPNSSTTRAQKPLLPKPLQQPLSQHTPGEDGPLTALRINTSDDAPRQQPLPPFQPASVDTERLRSIYEAHRAKFWASIASEYGSDVHASQLEHVWRQGGSGTPAFPQFQSTAAKPPTPGPSPDGSKLAHPPLPKLATNTASAPAHHGPVPFSGVTPASSMSGGPVSFHFPQYTHPSSSAVEPAAPPMTHYRGYSAVSAVSVPDYHRASFTLPTPAVIREERARSMSRTSSRESHGVPATKIEALLTEDRNPRPQTQSPEVPSARTHRDITMRDA